MTAPVMVLCIEFDRDEDSAWGRCWCGCTLEEHPDGPCDTCNFDGDDLAEWAPTRAEARG